MPVADQIPDSAKLLPCPFCGSDDVSMSFSATPQSSEPAHRFVECDMCGSCGAGVKIASGDDDGAKALAIDCWNTRAAPPAMDREAVERVREAAYRQALEDVCNPLGYLQRMADAEGAKLSGMAYAIASDIGTIQRIAKEALSTLSADAIRQGEGSKDWVPQIGERVAISPACPYLSDWSNTALWCCGVRVHDSGDGLDITVTEQWPMPSRHSRGYLGPTDGFRLNAAHYADDITRLATPAPAVDPANMDGAKIETYDMMHDIAVNDLGYPSILEALEAAPHASAPAVDAQEGDDEGPCTDCVDTGITIQTERACSCDSGDQYRAPAVDAVPAGEVERIAQAIYEEDDPWHKAWPWPNLNPEAQGGPSAADRYREIARAVLAALSHGEGRK
nr:Lar family restriction alleviation protein [Sphingomonas parapaucimobilis]